MPARLVQLPYERVEQRIAGDACRRLDHDSRHVRRSGCARCVVSRVRSSRRIERRGLVKGGKRGHGQLGFPRLGSVGVKGASSERWKASSIAAARPPVAIASSPRCRQASHREPSGPSSISFSQVGHAHFTVRDGSSAGFLTTTVSAPWRAATGACVVVSCLRPAAPSSRDACSSPESRSGVPS